MPRVGCEVGWVCARARVEGEACTGESAVDGKVGCGSETCLQRNQSEWAAENGGEVFVEVGSKCWKKKCVT